jgi:hypothetical protein
MKNLIDAEEYKEQLKKLREKLSALKKKYKDDTVD